MPLIVIFTHVASSVTVVALCHKRLDIHTISNLEYVIEVSCLIQTQNRTCLGRKVSSACINYMCKTFLQLLEKMFYF
jgi:hypothetical protein